MTSVSTSCVREQVIPPHETAITTIDVEARVHDSVEFVSNTSPASGEVKITDYSPRTFGFDSMYIGAWTEYRLAQEQLLNRRRRFGNTDDDVPQQRLYPDGSSRKRVVNYHPTVIDKGGPEVKAYPDREIFRKTLESVLSSNLPADDVESISQALEPLMQRLPTIGNAAQKDLNRIRRKRKDHIVRIGTERRRLGGCDNVRSDAGTRSNPEGAASGVSASSAPPTLNSATTKQGRGQNERVPSDTTACYREVVHRDWWVGEGSVPSERAQRSTNFPCLPVLAKARYTPNTLLRAAPSCNGSRSSPHESKGLDIRERGDAMRQLSRGHRVKSRIARTRFENPTSSPDEDENAGVKVGGGYDSGKATTLLRMTRKLGPGRMEADFKRFWPWVKKATVKPHDAASSSNKDKRALASSSSHAAAAVRTRPQHRGGDKRFGGNRRKRQAAGREYPVNTRKNSNARAIAEAKLKVETLEKMKEIYLAKDVSKLHNGCTYDADPSPSKDTIPIRYNGIGPDRDETGGISTEISSQKMQTNGVNGTARFSTSDDHRGQALSPPSDRDLRFNEPHCKDASSGLDDPHVTVPDLELTESRIRLVEKYFEGGLLEGRKRREGSSPLSPEGTAIVSLHRHVAGNHAKDVLDTKMSSDSEVRASIVSEADAASDKRLEKGKVDESDGIRSKSVVTNQSLGAGQDEMEREGRRRNAPDTASDECFPRHQGAEPDLPRTFGQQTGQNFSRSNRCDPLSRGNSEVVKKEIGTCRHIGSNKDERRMPLMTMEENRLRGDVTMSSPPLRPFSKEANSSCDCFPPASPIMGPAWSQDNDNCSATLEDLVCWTKGLDFEAAVEGF